MCTEGLYVYTLCGANLGAPGRGAIGCACTRNPHNAVPFVSLPGTAFFSAGPSGDRPFLFAGACVMAVRGVRCTMRMDRPDGHDGRRCRHAAARIKTQRGPSTLLRARAPLRLIGLLYAVQVDGILHHDAGDAGIDRAVPLPLQRLVGGVQALGAFQ